MLRCHMASGLRLTPDQMEIHNTKIAASVAPPSCKLFASGAQPVIENKQDNAIVPDALQCHRSDINPLAQGQ